MILKIGGVNQVSAYANSDCGLAHKKNWNTCIGILIGYGDASLYAVSNLHKSILVRSTDAQFTALTERCTTLAWFRAAPKALRINQDLMALSNTILEPVVWLRLDRLIILRGLITTTSSSTYVKKLIEVREHNLNKVNTIDMIADYLTTSPAPMDYARAVSGSK